jgi:hypothetical protein
MWSCAALEKGPVMLLMYLTGWFLSTIGRAGRRHELQGMR